LQGKRLPGRARRGHTRATAVALAAPAELLEHVLGEADPQKTKPLLRLLIDELRVNSRAEILQRRRMQRR
jgi:hypothetical protein